MKKIVFVLAILFIISFQLFGQWQLLNGPFETQGIKKLSNHPNGSLFASGQDFPYGNHAIYRSTNSGVSWSKVSNNLSIHSDGITSINFDLEGGIFIGSWGVYYYSSDNGDNWSTKTLNNVPAINSILFNNLGNIFLGTSGDNPGIYRSSIGGDIWTLLLNKNTADLLIDENNNIYAATTEGIYFSSDNGDTWIERNNGLPVAFCRNICRNSSSELFANVYYNGIYKSTNNGLNWVITNTSSPTNLWDFFIDQNDFLYACKLIPLGSGGIYKSINSGVSWIDLGLSNMQEIYCVSVDHQDNLYAGTYRALYQYSESDSTWQLGNIYKGLGNIQAFSFCQGNTILSSSSMRLWRSDDMGLSWIHLNDKKTPLISNGDNNRIFIANPLLYSDDCGISWDTTNASLSWWNYVSKICKNEENELIAGTVHNFYKSSDNGFNWSDLGSVPISVLGLNKINALAINSIGYLFASQSGEMDPYSPVWNTIRTTDNGQTFQRIYDSKNVLSILIDIENNLYIGTEGSGVLKSTNNGDTWSTINSGLTNLYVNDLIFSPEGVLLAATNNGVHRFVNSTNLWILVDNTGLVSKKINNMHFKDDVLYVGTGIGLAYFSGPLPVESTSFTALYSNPNVNLNWSTATELNNHGFEIERSLDKTNWATIGFREGKGTTSEPHQYSYSDKLSDISSSKLYYRLKQVDFNGSFEYSEIVEVEIAPTKFSLTQNYPNPFNPSTKISWQSPVGSWQTLKVYDILGNEVATLVNEYRPVGNYEIEFQSTVGSLQLASGIYYYQFRAGDYVETKKMILMK